MNQHTPQEPQTMQDAQPNDSAPNQTQNSDAAEQSINPEDSSPSGKDLKNPEGDSENLLDKVAELEAALKETQARANADMYNFKKRMERETQNSKKFAIERFAKDLLEVVDNLERAIAAAEEAGESGAMLDGVTLTHKTLLSSLAKHKVDVIDPAGEAFNAELHEAVGMDAEADSGMVGNVLQKGYQLDGRLLRPAMVTVGQ